MKVNDSIKQIRNNKSTGTIVFFLLILTNICSKSTLLCNSICAQGPKLQCFLKVKED